MTVEEDGEHWYVLPFLVLGREFWFERDLVHATAICIVWYGAIVIAAVLS